MVDNTSNAPTSWLWDFGDGNTSTQQNPTHTYATDSTFITCLTAANNCGTDSSCSSVTTIITDIENLTINKGFTIYPNPLIDELNIDFNDLITDVYDLHIYNSLGQVIYQRQSINSAIQVNTSAWEKGFYLVEIKNQQMNQTIKVVKK